LPAKSQKSAASVTRSITIDPAQSVAVLGVHDRIVAEIEALHPTIAVGVRGNTLTLRGNQADVDRAALLVEDLVALAESGSAIESGDVARIQTIERQTGRPAAEFLSHPILTSRGRSIRPKTLGQKNYVDAIDQHTIVFGIGPAGTGKTYLAMAKAVQALERKEVDRIILTRPAVEAGERLGFLPGTLTEKIDPYLRPLFDALQEMMDPEIVTKLLSSGVVEVAPLAYMRGRTLNQSFIILDEAQNTSPEQMKMFLTRLGFGSKMIITGDVTQVDLPQGTSGLKLVGGILEGIEGIHFHDLGAADVVRHSLVSAIVDAYARADAPKGRSR